MQEHDQAANSFTATLYARANAYFASRQCGNYANALFYFKGMLLVALYVYVYIQFVLFTQSFSGLLLNAVVLGICHVFIPVNISHDAIHQAVSPKQWINAICKYGFEITGSNSYMYGVKHLEAHRNKENGSKTVAIESQALLLQTKRASQAVNLPFISYLLYAQYMIFIRDFILYFTSATPISRIQFLKLFFFKVAYITAFLVLPFAWSKVAWWQMGAALLLMYLVVTIVLVIILLMPTEKMENSRLHANNNYNEKWVTEILAHNVDFSPKSVALNCIAGGANLNVVHYLFPGVNHVHYNQLAAIIEKTAAEFGLAYRKQEVKDVFGIHYNYLRNIQSTDN